MDIPIKIIIIIHHVYIALYIKIDLKALNKLKHATLKNTSKKKCKLL